jgi:hypothetical protein
LDGDTDVAQDRPGELGEKALDEIEPPPIPRREGELETAGWLVGKPESRLPGNV